MIIYELWHDRSSNLIASFDTEAETRRVLAEMFEDVSALVDFILTWDDVDRPGGLVAYGAALVEIARGRPFPPLVSSFSRQS